MNFENIWKIIEPIVSGVAIPLVISFLTARLTAKSEISKLRATWNREDDVAEKAAYSDMLAAVSQYLNKPPSHRSHRPAVDKTAVFRAVAPANLAPYVDALSNALTRKDQSGVDEALNALVRRNRNHEKSGE